MSRPISYPILAASFIALTVALTGCGFEAELVASHDDSMSAAELTGLEVEAGTGDLTIIGSDTAEEIEVALEVWCSGLRCGDCVCFSELH